MLHFRWIAAADIECHEKGRPEVKSKDEVLQAMRCEIGQDSEPGEWFLVDQALIDRYVAISGEDTWIHTDPDRARKETSFGNTIAPGNMGIALMPRLSRANSAYSRYPRRYSLNQGGIAFGSFRRCRRVPGSAVVQGCSAWRKNRMARCGWRWSSGWRSRTTTNRGSPA